MARVATGVKAVGSTFQKKTNVYPIRLTIEHNGVIFEPPIKDDVTIEWERTGTPGKLTFTTIKVNDPGMSFLEGDRVIFYYNNKAVFVGYVFKKSRDREHHIEVTCYDQLRYFKNKFAYVFTKKTAKEILQALTKDLGLKTGDLDDTKYVIPSLAENNKEAFDIILTAIDETLRNTGELYVLYDNAGNLELKNCANMVSNTIITDNTASNFDYSSSIDDETYNSIVLYYNPNSST